MSDAQDYPRTLQIAPASLSGSPDRVRIETGTGQLVALGSDYADALEKAALSWRLRRAERAAGRRD